MKISLMHICNALINVSTSSHRSNNANVSIKVFFLNDRVTAFIYISAKRTAIAKVESKLSTKLFELFIVGEIIIYLRYYLKLSLRYMS